jgi:hypothetical protein
MTDTIFHWAGKHNVPAHALVELMDLLDPTRRSVGIPTNASSEAAVQARLRLRAAQLGAALWRNNNGACKDDTGRLVRYGLGHDSARISDSFKSSDLIGIMPRQIEAYHVGQVWGVFAAVEVKAPGWSQPKNDREIAQANFGSNVLALGGYFKFATDVADVFP